MAGLEGQKRPDPQTALLPKASGPALAPGDQHLRQRLGSQVLLEQVRGLAGAPWLCPCPSWRRVAPQALAQTPPLPVSLRTLHEKF